MKIGSAVIERNQQWQGGGEKQRGQKPAVPEFGI